MTTHVALLAKLLPEAVVVLNEEGFECLGIVRKLVVSKATSSFQNAVQEPTRRRGLHRELNRETGAWVAASSHR